MSETETFGARLTRLREAIGWTREVLAKSLDHLNLPESATRYIEHLEECPYTKAEDCEYKVSLLVANVLANRLGVSLDYLCNGVESKFGATPGKRIRARRDELGWSVAGLVNQISKATNGGVGMSDREVALAESDCITCYAHPIAKALGVTPEWIMTGEEPKFPPKEPTDSDDNPLVPGEYYWVKSKISDNIFIWQYSIKDKPPDYHYLFHIKKPEIK